MQHDKEFKFGLTCAFAAFGLWGLAPIYFKWVKDISAFEVLCHRIIWSVAILLVVVSWQKQWRRIRELKWRTICTLGLSSIFVSSNWLIFIWAVGQDRVLETSLGYFINPLVSLLLGLLILGEKLRKIQGIAILLAAIGVLNQITVVGYLPWVALGLAFTFGFYGLMRKQLQIDPAIGLLIETLILLPFALIYCFWLNLNGELSFAHISFSTDLLLIASGFVTTIPLLLFAGGIQRLSLTIMSVAQYIVPSMTFFLAVFLYQEPFDNKQLITFVFIWAGLVIFTLEGIQITRRKA